MVSHPRRKYKDAAWMGHPALGLGWRGDWSRAFSEAVGLGSMVSHPSRKYKDAAWMGHPALGLG